MSITTRQCSKRVFSGERWDSGGHQCGKPAMEGSPFCKIHAPASGEPTTKWWRVIGYSEDRLESVDVISFTDKTITVVTPSGRKERQNRISDYARWFPTKAEAVEDAIEQKKFRVDILERQAAAERNVLKSLEALRESLNSEPKENDNI